MDALASEASTPAPLAASAVNLARACEGDAQAALTALALLAVKQADTNEDADPAALRLLASAFFEGTTHGAGRRVLVSAKAMPPRAVEHLGRCLGEAAVAKAMSLCETSSDDATVACTAADALAEGVLCLASERGPLAGCLVEHSEHLLIALADHLLAPTPDGGREVSHNTVSATTQLLTLQAPALVSAGRTQPVVAAVSALLTVLGMPDARFDTLASAASGVVVAAVATADPAAVAAALAAGLFGLPLHQHSLPLPLDAWLAQSGCQPLATTLAGLPAASKLASVRGLAGTTPAAVLCCPLGPEDAQGRTPNLLVDGFLAHAVAVAVGVNGTPALPALTTSLSRVARELKAAAATRMEAAHDIDADASAAADSVGGENGSASEPPSLNTPPATVLPAIPPHMQAACLSCLWTALESGDARVVRDAASTLDAALDVLAVGGGRPGAGHDGPPPALLAVADTVLAMDPWRRTKYVPVRLLAKRLGTRALLAARPTLLADVVGATRGGPSAGVSGAVLSELLKGAMEQGVPPECEGVRVEGWELWEGGSGGTDGGGTEAGSDAQPSPSGGDPAAALVRPLWAPTVLAALASDDVWAAGVTTLTLPTAFGLDAAAFATLVARVAEPAFPSLRRASATLALASAAQGAGVRGVLAALGSCGVLADAARAADGRLRERALLVVTGEPVTARLPSHTELSLAALGVATGVRTGDDASRRTAAEASARVVRRIHAGACALVTARRLRVAGTMPPVSAEEEAEEVEGEAGVGGGRGRRARPGSLPTSLLPNPNSSSQPCGPRPPSTPGLRPQPWPACTPAPTTGGSMHAPSSWPRSGARGQARARWLVPGPHRRPWAPLILLRVAWWSCRGVAAPFC